MDKRVLITTLKLDSPNSAGGCDVEFFYTNMYDNTIKYLRWIGAVYNAVSDPVTCEISGESFLHLRIRGHMQSLMLVAEYGKMLYIIIRQNKSD